MKFTDPKISIVLPTYNRATLILETIESICQQSFQNWELLVIDDCSTDGTEDLIKKVNDERIKLYRTATRLGIAGSRNEGLQKATAELIAFIDSDDLWAGTKLEKQLLAMEKYPDAGFSLTNGYNFKTISEPDAFFYKQREGVNYGNIFLAFFRSEASATMPSLIIRKKCLDITGSFKAEGTLDFFLKLAKNFNAVILYEPLFYRRLHEENYSSINSVKRHYQGIERLRSYKNYIPQGIYRDAMFRSSINFGEKCLEKKERRKAIVQFLKAWKYKPLSIVPIKKTIKAIF
jgi:glycosyltransferase involved in cell wall biosynthesis